MKNFELFVSECFDIVMMCDKKITPDSPVRGVQAAKELKDFKRIKIKCDTFREEYQKIPL